MAHVSIVGTTKTDDALTLRFAGASADSIADRIATYLAGRGYHLESGDRKTGVYGRGSAAAHAILGPLVRREKINVTVSADEDAVTVVFAQGMSGMGGGFLGRRKMNKEMQDVIMGVEQTLLN